ncbi:MYXO-CTERM sorting domain-containing protein [Nannocystaceae bacterium ST9]
MHATRTIGLGLSLATYFTLTSVAWAGTVTVQGNVTALDDVTQIPSVVGSALFDEQFSGEIPVDQYPGMTFGVGEFAMILPGVMEVGEVPDPMYTSPGVFFPAPIPGGGVQQGYILLSGAAVTFADPITQVGMTVGWSSTLYLTVWDQSGVMIGQITWEPEDGDATFLGVDTNGVPIGMLTVGNDDIWAGVAYDDLGPAARSDTWIWGVGAPCQTEADCLDDTWPCTAHECVDGACNYPLTTEPCDDTNACTDVDTCSEGVCAGTQIECADTSICTFDSCDPRVGCSNEPIEGCCLSDEDCPEGQTCLVGSNTCLGGPGDGDGDSTTTTTTGGTDTGEDTGTGDETGPAVDEGDKGCGCSTGAGGGGVALGLLALVVLGGVRRREG